ncbi:response regulator [Desulfobacterales bacterium HSG16]|nr:response regulator [Desulfobacterales bacterium HSG16]
MSFPDSKQNDILIVDDTPENLNVLMQILTEQGYRVRPVLNGELALQVVQKSMPDLILLDILMAGTDGYEVCRRLKAEKFTRDIPIIFISALSAAADKIRAFEIGGVDYITKPFQEEEVLARVKAHLGIYKMQIRIQAQNQRLQEEIRERKQTEQALRDSEEKLRAIMNAAADAIVLLDDRGKIIYSNPASEKIFGYTVDELKNQEMHSLLIPFEFHEFYKNEFKDFLKTGQIPAIAKTSELTIIKKDGTVFPVELSVSALKMNNKWHAAGIVHDITGKKEMQEEVIRARKLESIGILAGGIAHDYNNLLSVILGNIELAEDDIKPDSRCFKFLKKAEAASMKTKDLTSQLLTFSKGGVPFKKSGSIGNMVKKIADSILSESDVKCKFSIQTDLKQVEFDKRQIGQAFRNIIANAVEFMPLNGLITLSAENVKIDSKISTKKLPLLQGNYVKTSIQDQGVGISQKNLSKIFDPYFSTKTRGIKKGMGLGLTIAWSVITRHGGHIAVESKVGTGTSFTVYLPAFEKDIKKTEEQRSANKLEKNLAVLGKKILVMDDEEMVRDIACQMLKRIGYEVELANDGAEATEIYKKAYESGKIFDAVILDLTIKGGIGGLETVKSLINFNPQIKAVVSSGYSDDPVMTDYEKYGFTGTLAKPYTMKNLTETLSVVGL